MGETTVVQTKDLSKFYNGKAAVNRLNLVVRTGEIYGFIGRNGAGKSTTLKMICGLAYPTQGDISLFGRPVRDEAVRRRVGLLIEDAGLFRYLPARENMILKAQCMGLADMGEIDRLLKLVHLENTGNKKTGQFSMGMKQRLGIAMALMGNPDLLVLDEPINGLDPEGIREIRNILRQLNEEEGKTLLISSHMLGELSKLATSYGIIKDGEMVEQMSRGELEEKCRDYLRIQVNDPERATALLAEQYPDAVPEVCGGGEIHLYNLTDTGAVTSLLVHGGVTVNVCALHQRDLEHYFLDLMEGGAANE